MSSTSPRRQRRVDRSTTHTTNGHLLVAVTEWLPGKEPSKYDLELSEGLGGYRARYWRCTHCGQERNHREDFFEECEVTKTPHPITDGGYPIEESRTRRALTEEMDVRFGSRGNSYPVHSQSGSTYMVNIERKTCTCPDHLKRDTICKHIRRVDLEIWARKIPGPDGTFARQKS